MAEAASLARQLEFARRIALLHDLLPFSVTSWWRTPARNARVGGVPRSKHLDGTAADLVPDDGSDMPALAEHARSLGLFALLEGSHVHVHLPTRYTGE